MSKKSKQKDVEALVNEAEVSDTGSPKEEKTKAVDYPKKREMESLQYYFGKRRLEPFDNSEVLRGRLSYRIESAKIKNCIDIFDKNTGARLGIVPNLQIKYSWRMAHSKDAQKVMAQKPFFMSFEEWKQDANRLEKYIIARRSYNKNAPVFFSDVWELSEMDYQSAGLKRPQQFMALLQTAILGEIEENRRLIQSWKKIKKYIHKVPLAASKGGIFSDEDAKKLTETLNIKYLNDIRKLNIFDLKNSVLEFDFEDVVKDINKAYKEDLARRKDFRYKVWPFVAAFVNLAVVLVLGYINKYKLIKDKDSTILIMALFTLCVLDAAVIYLGGRRAVRRRLTRPDYFYYTDKVTKAIKRFALVGVFAVISIFVFYQRYDDFDTNFYYRYMRDDTASVAGMVNDELVDVVIPSKINDKTVSEIDRKAFKSTAIKKVKLAEGIKKIDKGAFEKCMSLTNINLPDSLEVIGKDAFKKCYVLDDAKIPQNVTEIGTSAYDDSGIGRLDFAEGASVIIGKKAFRNCMSLTELVGVSSISEIGKKAFKNCEKLGDIAFADSLKSIGNKAFENCVSIQTLTIPESVEYIGSGAFEGCDGLHTVSLPYAGTSRDGARNQSIEKTISFSNPSSKSVMVTLNTDCPIAKNNFSDVKWITELVLDDGITEIAGGAFSGMDRLKKIKMPTGVTEIQDSMFAEARSLTAVTGMAKVTSVGSKAFYGCSSLESIDLESVERINESAFEGCKELTTIGKLTSLAHLGAGAFRYCENLSGISQLPSIESVGGYAFEGCVNLSGDITFGGKLLKLSEYALYSSRFNSVILSEGTTEIGAHAFESCGFLNQVRLPSTLRSVGMYAFGYCSNLTSIDFSATDVETLGNYVFTNCGMLSNVKLGTKLTAIPEGAFYSCVSMKGTNSITNIEQLSIKSIGQSAFEGCGGYAGANVYIPDTVNSIGSRAFYAMAISSLEIPNSVSTIGESAFNTGGSISSATMPFIGESRTKTDNGYTWLFGNATSVSDIVISDTEVITATAFKGGETKVKRVGFGGGVEKIEAKAFMGFVYLSTVKLSDEITYVGESAFENCRSLTEINIPNGLNVIRKATFKNCTALYDIDFGTLNLTEIASEAFYGTAVGQGGIIFNEGLVTVGKNAFSSCKNISNIFFSSTMKQVDDGAFGVVRNINIYVPNEELYEQYTELFEGNFFIEVRRA